jgi:hypothetical protein
VMPLLRGRDSAVRALARFLALIPDLEITIFDSMSRGDHVFIEFGFAGSIGKRRVSWRLVDHIELADGLVRQRISYFDPLPALRAVLVQPTLWSRFIAAIRN